MAAVGGGAFGGKKLKDLTEEDIRRYAESLALGASSDAVQPGPGQTSAEDLTLAVTEGAEQETELDPGLVAEARRLALARGAGQQVEEQQKKLTFEREAERQRKLREEEEARLQVLREMDRSQMPAIQSQDGALQKTIEHYTFADAEDKATIYVELDKDLFEGAADFVSDDNVEVCTKDSEVTILLHGVPASKMGANAAEWRLRIGPLFHSVEASATTWRIRKGKLAVILRKKKKQEWRRLVKI